MGSHFADTVELGNWNGFAQYFIGGIQFADGFIGALDLIKLCPIAVIRIFRQRLALYYGKSRFTAQYAV